MSKPIFEIKFEGYDAKKLNDVRRYILSDMPTLAITQVFIEENTSSHDDEIIAHRISQVPILSNPLDFVEVVDDQYNETNTVVIELDIANLSHEPQYILSEALKVNLTENQSNIDIPFKNLTLFTLQNNKKVKLKALATLGSGKIDSKFSPVSSISIDVPNETVRMELIGNLTPSQIESMLLSKFVNN